MASIWSEVLSIERVGVHDDFFNLGGNSLLALRLASRVRQVFNVDLPLMTLFTAPTVAALAEQIVALQAGEHRLDVPPILPVPHDGPVRASLAQEPFWFVQQMSPSATILNMHGALPMTGELDLDALRGTINEIIRRHESLRTTFAMTDSGELMQVVAPQMRIDLPVEDLGHLPEQERRAQMQNLSRQQAAEPFDLGQEAALPRAAAAVEREGTRTALDHPPRHLRRLVAGRARPRGCANLRRHAFGPAFAAAAAADSIRRLRRLAAQLPARRDAGIAAGLLAQQAGGAGAAGTAYRSAAAGDDPAHPADRTSS